MGLLVTGLLVIGNRCNWFVDVLVCGLLVIGLLEFVLLVITESFGDGFFVGGFLGWHRCIYFI